MRFAIDLKRVFCQTFRLNLSAAFQSNYREVTAMDRILRAALVSAVTMLGFCLGSGCSRSTPEEAVGTSREVTANPPSDAVARAAADFLDAVLKGDTQRASARLTPQAMQRIIASGKQFAPPGLETATFRIGQVRSPADGQALVQCVLTDTSSPDGPRNEEMCCLMRLVDNDWRVSGIAYGTSPDQPWTLSNFETGQNFSLPRQPSMEGQAGPPTETAAAPSDRAAPPRTAQEQPPVVR